MRKIFSVILFIVVVFRANGQELSSFRSKMIPAYPDTIIIDTLPIVPGSEIVFHNDKIIWADSIVTFFYFERKIVIHTILPGDSILIMYQVFNDDFTKPYFHQRYEDMVKTDISGTLYNMESPAFGNQYRYSSLNTSGSISRGITVGSNQDAVLNSKLNLQIDGKLTDNLNVRAVISDNTVPLQPDGYSQQINEFDKIFVEVYNENLSFTLGDIELIQKENPFLVYQKKGLGVNLQTFSAKEKYTLNTATSGSVAKGKYHKMFFKGQEGNQGPYKLTGPNNEQFLIVLSGSERVYIDGRLLTRGSNNDYIIDYNAAEITFTTNQLITKDKRITIEFEYSDKNYNRYLVTQRTTFNQEKRSFYLDVYSESDSKSQPYQQELSADEKQMLANAGDNTDSILVSSARFDTTLSAKEYVKYALVDTIINNQEVAYYRYSTSEDSAKYIVSFTDVGANNGDYIFSVNNANGRVYKWVGSNNGDYIAKRNLVTPQKHQAVSMGGEIQLIKNIHLISNITVTSFDKNTYSEYDSRDNTGLATRVGLKYARTFKDSLGGMISSTIIYEHSGKNFMPLQRFKPVEFERSWNLPQQLKPTETLSGYDLVHWQTDINRGKLNAGYAFHTLNHELMKKGIKNSVNIDYGFKTLQTDALINLVNTRNDDTETRFLTYQSKIENHLKPFTIGVFVQGEENIWRNADGTFLINSYSFYETGAYVRRPDKHTNTFFVEALYREDYIADSSKLKLGSVADEVKGGFTINSFKNQQIKTTLTFRELNIKNDTLSNSQNEKTVLGRFDYKTRALKNSISTNVFYELGSGLERKDEFSYLKVAAGQGNYTWRDHNNNGTAEIDEFEVAQFQDEANYIRIFNQSNDYIRVFSNQFNGALNIDLNKLFTRENTFHQIFKRVYNSFAYRVINKTYKDDFWQSANPFEYGIDDDRIVKYQTEIRNKISLNRMSQRLSADYLYSNAKSRELLYNGFSTRELLQHTYNVKWGVSDNSTLNNSFEHGTKESETEFSKARTYRIDFLEYECRAVFQAGMNWQFEGNYSYSEKTNHRIPSESDQTADQLESHTYGADIQWNGDGSRKLVGGVTYTKISFDGISESASGYEMLEGLTPGKNILWNIGFSQLFKGGLQINLNYEGRSVDNSETIIHTGSMTARYNF